MENTFKCVTTVSVQSAMRWPMLKTLVSLFFPKRKTRHSDTVQRGNMRVICDVCGYVSKSLPDYRRHVRENPECNSVSRKRKRMEQRQKMKQQQQQADVVERRYFPVKTVKLGQVLSSPAAFESENPLTWSIPRPVSFTIFPGRAK